MKTRTLSRSEPECLEGRTLLSALVHPHHIHSSRVASVVSTHPVKQATPLQGAVTGDYVTKPSAGSAGSDVSLSGNGTVGSLGTVQAWGVIHNGLPNRSKPALGTLVLSNNQGTIQLALKGQGGRQTLMPVSVFSNSVEFRYTIVGGTGAYRKFHGNGLVTLVKTPNLPPTLPPTPFSGRSDSASGSSGPGASGGVGTGTGPSNGTGMTLPPAPVPPVAGGGSSTTPGKTLPPSQWPPTPGSGHAGAVVGNSDPAGSLSEGVRKSAAQVSTALLPTFLRGRFTLVFNGGPPIVPPL
jgi:hypothetical protein